jgi:hypothetical protein
VRWDDVHLQTHPCGFERGDGGEASENILCVNRLQDKGELTSEVDVLLGDLPDGMCGGVKFWGSNARQKSLAGLSRLFFCVWLD